MGLFNFSRKFKSGNFSLIASNVAEIYAILKYKYPHCFPNKKVMVLTAGIINAARYFQYNKMSPRSILDLADYPEFNDEDNDFKEDVDALVSFLWFFESTLFAIDTRLGYREILEIVADKRPVIGDSVSKVLSNAKNNKNFKSTWRSPITSFMNLSEFKPLREEIGIINKFR